MFKCPECEHQPFDNIKGWKRHMTTEHQGHTAEQLDEAIGSRSEGTALTGEQDLASAIAGMPLTEDDSETSVIQESYEEKKLRKDAEKEAKAARKRIQAKFDSFKSRVTTDVPEQMFKYAGITLEDKDKQWLQESLELGMEVIGVQIEVTPYNIPIRNPLWILLYPLLVMGFIIGKAILTGTYNIKNESDNGK